MSNVFQESYNLIREFKAAFEEIKADIPASAQGKIDKWLQDAALFLEFAEGTGLIDDTVWVEKDTMFRVGGSKDSFRCDCGSNVFRKSADGKKAHCNGCSATYSIE